MSDNPLLAYIPQVSKNPLMDYVPDKNPLMDYAPKQSGASKVFNAVTQPLSKTLGNRTAQETLLDENPAFIRNPQSKFEYGKEFAKQFGLGMLGDVVDIAQTPATYIPLPVGKILGKIPLGKTTLGELATRPLGNTTKKIMAQTQKEVFGATVSPEQKIITALEEAQPLRSAQEALYSKARSQKAGISESIGKEMGGEEGFYKQLGALRGALPKVNFMGIRDKVGQSDINSLFNSVQSSKLLPFEKITAKSGILKLLGAEGGVVPTEGEISLLSQVFSKRFIDTVLSKRPLMEIYGENVAEILNVPRALMTTLDLSAPLRQGVFMIGRLKQFIPAFGSMFKYAFSEKAYQGLINDIKVRPTYPLMREAKLPITEIGGMLNRREEAFMSNILERVPGLGQIVRGSNRAYSGFLNKLRADVFDDLVKKAESNGVEVTDRILKDLGRFIGAATGRGELPKVLRSSAPILNAVLFSPRLMASRLNLLNPQFYMSLDPMVRKEALKSLFSFAGTAGTVLSLAASGGADVGIDPRSADFGKIKIGNTRYDILGGFQQYMRLAAQLITGEYISSTTGVKKTLGEGYKPLTRGDIAMRFLQTKEAPVASFVTQMLQGRSFGSDEFNVSEEVLKRVMPMMIQDLTELYKERGLEAVGMEIPAIFGVGVQTYAPTPSETVYSANSVVKNAKQLSKQGRDKEANDLLLKNKDIVILGKQLEPIQKRLNAIEKYKEDSKKDARLTMQEKRNRIVRSNEQIKQIQSQMEDMLSKLKAEKP